MNIILNKVVAAASGALLVVGLAACSSSGGGTSGVRVVASTDVYGDIVKQIAGSTVSVTSIISDPNQDPHSYEANTRTQLELSRADLVIENGGGYDDFVDRMLGAAGTHPTTINVVQLSGHRAPAGGDLNEHVWYDFPTVVTLARTIATDLAAKDHRDAATFRANTATFVAEVQAMEGTEASIRRQHAGTAVAITEPVPLYLLEACGLTNKTPPAFSHAIEEGSDVSVSVLQQTLALLTAGKVKALVYNEQTSGVDTQRVLDAAKAGGVAVVPVTETLPAGTDYVQWMQGNLEAIAHALG